MKNFGYYKNNIDSILENSFTNGDEFKRNLSVVMGAMKYSRVLREFFTLYNEIENKHFDNAEDSKEYINEAVNFLKNNKTKLNKVTPILNKIILDRKELCIKKSNKIYENIDNVVFNDSIIELEKISKSKKFLSENTLKAKKVVSKIKNPKILSHVLSKNYGEAYNGELTENQQIILKNTLLMTEDSLSSEFNNVKEITLNKIGEMLKESKDDNLSVKLVEVKNEIRELNTSKKSYIRVRSLLEDLN
jgi:hypothetical protein|tara:strand:- start:351 stop:1091 length:741 start_codon:yes stop_codon:yes gene_type:complete